MTDLWPWSLKVYTGEGVAEALLALQDDHSQCVPLLLWALWCATEGADLDLDTAAKAARVAQAWEAGLIKPLRLLRRRLKWPLSECDDEHRLPLREKIKVIELDAERAVLDELGLLTPAKDELKQTVNIDALANLLTVAHAWSPATVPPSFSALLQALSEGDFLRYNG